MDHNQIEVLAFGIPFATAYAGLFWWLARKAKR